MTDPLPVDIGVGVVFGQLSSETPEDSDGADRRVLHASWLSELKGPQSSDCRNTGVITSFRELRFDPRIDRLVENPIFEYLRLRKDILFQTTVSLQAAKGPQIMYAEVGGLLMDTEFSIAIPSSFKSGNITIGVRCGNLSCTDGARISLGISEPDAALSQRQISMQVLTPEQTPRTSFPLLAGEITLPMRIMSDHRTVEVFAGSGRGVFSGSMYSTDVQVMASCDTGDFQVAATGWALASVVGKASTSK
eukprot:CAMPEP_0172945784 /NCGR_PEP_ID=MMETSP1075-20121228/226728_1 /TAXON_ID=2916 /ORGANISM="Ceratium fusus, Strain PA161109" /LENGTH=248 /DNA_ID=CAMNT_0013807227 /DNA_START=16 /DNA_END=759 /DNA_ORIENTATION=+